MFCPECKTAYRKQIAVCATWIFLSPLLFLSSCFLVPSVHPLYTEADIVFDPALLGVWTADDSKDTLTFIEEGANSYKLIVAGDDGPKGEFIVHLVKIGGARFLDLQKFLLAHVKTEGAFGEADELKRLAGGQQ